MTRSRPHFLHIGPEKTGTSWLCEMLRLHPQIELPPVKEIRYFYECSAYPGEGPAGRFLGRDWHSQDYRSYLLQRARFYLAHPRLARRSLERLRWDLDYLFGRRSDDWFESLFARRESALTGDFSPQTFDIKAEDVRMIARKWPHLKLLLVLREPVEWTWSFARMSLIKERDPSAIADSRYCSFFQECLASYPTLANISKWEQYFGDRLKILFFDDLATTPDRFLTEVCQFLGLAAEPILKRARTNGPKNRGRSIAMPEHFRRKLIALFEEEVRQLADRFGEHPKRWLRAYTELQPPARG